MRSRASARWLTGLFALLATRCTGASPATSDRVGLERAPGGPALPDGSPCSGPGWHVLRGPSIGRVEQPARHREPESEVAIESAAGFEVGRASVVRSAQGEQLLVEVTNVEERWRCGIRSGVDGELGVLAATGMHLTTREGIRGCLGPGELGYLQIKLSDPLAKVSLRLEAASDGMPIGPPPACVVPTSYTYVQGALSIDARAAGMTDPTYKPVLGGGLAVVLVLDEAQLPVALYSLAASTPEALMFSGAISLSTGHSQSLAVLVW